MLEWLCRTLSACFAVQSVHGWRHHFNWEGQCVPFALQCGSGGTKILSKSAVYTSIKELKPGTLNSDYI